MTTTPCEGSGGTTIRAQKPGFWARMVVTNIGVKSKFLRNITKFDFLAKYIIRFKRGLSQSVPDLPVVNLEKRVFPLYIVLNAHKKRAYGLKCFVNYFLNTFVTSYRWWEKYCFNVFHVVKKYDSIVFFPVYTFIVTNSTPQ